MLDHQRIARLHSLQLDAMCTLELEYPLRLEDISSTQALRMIRIQMSRHHKDQKPRGYQDGEENQCVSNLLVEAHASNREKSPGIIEVSAIIRRLI